MTTWLERCRLQPYKHQIEGVERLIKQPFFALFDEMGAGKTFQVINAAQILAEKGLISHAVVIAPASVRAVWFDPELGELSKHLWAYFPTRIIEYHAKVRTWDWFVEVDGQKYQPKLTWIITNYDYIRNQERLTNELLPICSPKTFLILDESSAIKSWKAQQTKACEKLRGQCGRIVILNGTPIANNPADLYTQSRILSPKILECKTFFHFRARYGIMGGWQGKQIVGWRFLEDLQTRLSPHVLRRLKSQCLDLPPKIDSVIISTTLTPQTWKIYKEMRDDMVAWLSQASVSSASQAIVRMIRLAQITSGFIGGVETQAAETDPRPEWLEAELPFITKTNQPVQEIGREKLDVFLDWLWEQLKIDPNLKLLIWCRFRPELERLYNELAKESKLRLGKIWGGQKRPEREDALRLLDPRTTPEEPVVVIGTPASGSMGLNLAAAHTVVYASNDFSLKTRLQSEDRVHRPGQLHPVSYFDIIATGPQGQKTVDHIVIRALKNKQELADLTTSAWIDALMEE